MVHIVLLTVVILAFLGRNNNKNIQRLAFFLLFVFGAIRYMYGSDYLNYMTKFELIKAGADPFGGELLYTLLCKMLPSYYWLIAVTSGLFVFAMYRMITKNLPSEYVWLGLFVLLINPALFLMSLSAIRQSSAIVFFVFAVDMAYKRKPIQYVLLVVAGALFHKSLWLMLPLYFFLTEKSVKTSHILLVLAGFAVVFFAVDLPLLAQTVAEMFNDNNYIFYAQSDLQNTLRATLLTAVFFVYILFNLPRLEGKARVYGKLHLLGTLFGLFGYHMSMFTRIQMIFDIFSAVALPMVFLSVQKRGPIVINQDNVLLTLWDCFNKYAMPVLLVLIYGLRYYSFFTNEMWVGFVHYDTIFSLL